MTDRIMGKNLSRRTFLQTAAGATASVGGAGSLAQPRRPNVLFVIGADNNNDGFYFERVGISNYSKAAWSIENSQAKNSTFIACSFDSNGLGDYGVRSYRASMVWIG